MPQTWLGRVIASPLSRYGYFLCCASALLRFGLRYRASKPISRIRRLTRLMLITSSQSMVSHTHIRRTPKKGLDVYFSSIRRLNRRSSGSEGLAR